MAWETIHKLPARWRMPPNLADYERARASASWDDERRELDGLPGGGLNIAHEAVDRHALGPSRDRVALSWLGREGQVRDFTYAELRAQTNRFANVLDELGVKAGERVFVLAGRIPELYIAALGTLKHRSVFCPLFSQFGPEPVRQRLSIGDGRVLVTTPALYRKKVAQLRPLLPRLRHVILVGGGDEVEDGTLGFGSLMMDASPAFEIPVGFQNSDRF
jgi:acetyl-CoA synthetase